MASMAFKSVAGPLHNLLAEMCEDDLDRWTNSSLHLQGLPFVPPPVQLRHTRNSPQGRGL